MQRFDGYGVLITGAGQGIGAATARRLGPVRSIFVGPRRLARHLAALSESSKYVQYEDDPPPCDAPHQTPRADPRRSTGQDLAAEGARVLVTDLDEKRAATAAGSIPGAVASGCDVADRSSVEAAVAYAVECFGSLDVLVNNAYACTPDAPLFEDEPDEVWARDLDITLTGAFRCARAALPHLVASGRGSIVTIGSVNGEQDFGNHAYSAAKAGLTSLTRTLAGHAAPRGVRVNLVAPGTIHTDAWTGREAELGRAAAHYPMGRVGTPDDIAAAVAFLASPDASWITGTTLPVDGGLLTSNVGLRRAIGGQD